MRQNKENQYEALHKSVIDIKLNVFMSKQHETDSAEFLRVSRIVPF